MASANRCTLACACPDLLQDPVSCPLPGPSWGRVDAAGGLDGSGPASEVSERSRAEARMDNADFIERSRARYGPDTREDLFAAPDPRVPGNIRL
jgi:hypothetical protein